jgi:hypothetical protein
MHTRRYDEYVEGHHDDEIYQKEIEHYKTPPYSNAHISSYSCMCCELSGGAGLIELDTGDVELLDEEACPSNKGP